MAPETHSVVRAAQAWLLSSWHVQVPFAWLDACVDWLQAEAGGAARLPQQQINQQVLDQWLLTDLRDLDHPVLPEGLAQAQKTELSGTFCVQVDSFLDISQPAYGQLQKWRGTDCMNDEVSAVTQTSQKPWEVKPTRMLLLQVTDGVQSLEAMEYQTIPALSAALRPGAKLQLQGQMVCRLGVLLLGPSNVKVLGGEVEDLVDRNNKGRVLCRTLGLPEEQQQEGEEAAAPQQENQEMEDLEVNDAELLASLEAQGDADGFGALQGTSTVSSISSSISSHISIRGETSHRGGLNQSNRGGSVEGHHSSGDRENSGHVVFVPPDVFNQDIREDNMTEDFPDEEFDDLPLDELDSVIFLESENLTSHSDSRHKNTPQNSIRNIGNPRHMDTGPKPQATHFEPHALSNSGSRNSRSNPQKRDYQGCTRDASSPLITASSKSSLPSTALERSHGLKFASNDEKDFIDDDMDCLFQEVDASRVQTERSGGMVQLHVEEGPSRARESPVSKTEASSSSCRPKTVSSIYQEKCYSSNTSDLNRVASDQTSSRVPDVSLTSPPFTYLCLLEELMSKPHFHTTEIQVKAFIVTLLGKLSSNNGVWRVCATISDGTSYLDVELSNDVLTSLLGFSVAEKGALKRDPSRRGELEAGMKRCQEELVDMCCLMKIVVEPGGRKAVVARADPVNERVLKELEHRMRERKK
ncbi:recQ-mediated genome instability protein 1 [Melanotaenia boesemani]|uniref:recQ-mediated genome instability protein 1 n=1 Tax=Melanotaenia boesemani TaxID=1250792 RepID=UPI001C05BB1E|nr:recQ-mediated genome instability protein 1 [Melanotaenia boesemani]XP_041855055.1 recQ-mediated genome instability protein 1 [Melanotaenia boesemani]XP_041855056.1 recQ-mediated genome instability protein 1 [Melanotaenia boesemani]XP_041855057.1 recQ-mediated genome instability protein 1 [Melanotaenia boesemani]XP_041855058.1 recQ-mediated genome instability protein 1 [Melanotaenia boesemani]